MKEQDEDAIRRQAGLGAPEPLRAAGDATLGGLPVATVTGSERRTDEALLIPLVEERLALTKRRVAGGAIRVSTRTELRDEVAELEVDRYRVEVTRVPIGRIVEAAPAARTEGDTTVVPVIEERLVVVKQLFLTEELHIRHVVEREVKRETVPLRSQRAVVERRDASGRLVAAEPE